MNAPFPARIGLDQWFAHKVCLNLDRRPERWARMRQRFEALGVSDVLRFPAVDGQNVPVPAAWRGTAGAYGCLQTNLAVVRHAGTRRWPDVLVFEDDVVFDDEFTAKLPNFMAQVPSDWDMLFFGGMHREAPRPVCENVVRLAGSTSTYAYAVRNTIYRAFTDVHASSTEPIDVRNRRLQQHFNCYCFLPHLAWVEGGPSDTQARPVNPWWLRDSLILGGTVIDDLQARTLIVIPQIDGPSADLADRNLRHTVSAYQRHLPRSAIVVVGHRAAIDRVDLPPTCSRIALESARRIDAARCFNEAIAQLGQDKDFYVCAHRDVVPTWDIRAQLLKCLDHDLASSARELIDLTVEDSARVARWQAHAGADYSPRPRRALWAEGCVMTRAAFAKSGGWSDDGADDVTSPSLRCVEGLTLFDSPAVAMRLFAGDDPRAEWRRAC